MQQVAACAIQKGDLFNWQSMNGQTLAIWMTTTALVIPFSLDAFAATATTEQIYACENRVVFELNGVPRGKITASAGSLEPDGSGLVNWSAQDGRNGYCWVASDGTVLEFGFDNAAITRPLETAPATAGEATVSTDGGALNVRSSPGGEVISSLPNGSTVVLTGQTDAEWVEIEGGGWVSSYLISRTGSGGSRSQSNPAVEATGTSDSASNEPNQAAASGGGNQAVVATGGAGLLIRDRPEGEVSASLPDGATVVLTGQRDGSWVEIEGGGWVSEAYLEYR